MHIGALAGFAATYASHSLALGVSAAMLAGGLLALLHAVYASLPRANHVVCGLALAVLGIGLSSFLGRPIIGQVGLRFTPWPIPRL